MLSLIDTVRGSLLLPLFFLSGCVNTPVVLDLDETSSTRNLEFPFKNTHCTLVTSNVEDARKDKASIGTIGTQPIKSDEVLAWIHTSLKEADFLLEADRKENTLHIDIKLILLHMRTTDGIMKTNVVFSVNDTKNNQKFYLRGSDTKVLWFGAETEFKESFSRALNQVLQKIKLGTKHDCTLKQVKDLPIEPVQLPSDVL